RDVGRLGATQNLVGIVGSVVEQPRIVWSIGHQTSCFDELSLGCDHRQPRDVGQGIDEFEPFTCKIAGLDRQAVTLPPGRARPATSPLPMGSFATANTIGMTDVVCFAVRAAAPVVTMTSTLSCTNSAAISA